MPETENVRVQLLVPRTGRGKRGAIASYTADEAREHQARGLCRILPEDEQDPERDEADPNDTEPRPSRRRKPRPSRPPAEPGDETDAA